MKFYFVCIIILLSGCASEKEFVSLPPKIQTTDVVIEEPQTKMEAAVDGFLEIIIIIQAL